MRRTTIVWAKFESKGKPSHTKTVNLEVGEMILEFARWMAEVEMGHKIHIVIGRTESDVIGATAQQQFEEGLSGLIESMFDNDESTVGIGE